MRKSEDSLLLSILMLAISAGSMVLTAIVGYWMWLWFMVPLGLPAITALHALGIDALVTFWVSRVREEDMDTMAVTGNNVDQDCPGRVRLAKVVMVLVTRVHYTQINDRLRR